MKILTSTILVTAALALAGCSSGGGAPDPVSQAPAPPPPPVAANTAPVISGLSKNESVAQDASTELLAFTVTDAETASSALTVTAESSNLELISSDGIQLSGNGDSRVILLTPSEGAAGVSTVTITATDAAGLASKQALDVNVTSEERLFKDLVAAAFTKGVDAEGEQIAGYKLVDNAEDDEASFDNLLVD